MEGNHTIFINFFIYQYFGNISTDFLFTPPNPITADYIEIGFLTICLLIGGPLNLYALCKSIQSYLATTTPGPFLMMELHLNCADLLIIFFYGLSELIWISTYSWEGGNFLCKITKTIQLFVFYLTSNVVVCIAIERVYATFRMHELNWNPLKQVKWMMKIAWILAAITSIPPVCIWSAYQPYVFPCK